MRNRAFRRHQAVRHMRRRLKEDRNQHYNNLTCPCCSMDRLVNFRAPSFLSDMRRVATERGIPVSRLIRDAVLRDIASATCARVAR